MSNEITNFNIPPSFPQIEISKKSSIFSHLSKLINENLSFFQKKTSGSPLLNGRILELHKNAQEFLSVLQTLKREIQISASPNLFTHIENALDPIIFEINKIQESYNINMTPTEQTQLFKKYNRWISKAKVWLPLRCNSQDRILIEKIIIKHEVHKIAEKIDRDLQVIEDYKRHFLENLAIREWEKDAITQKLDSHLAPFIKTLERLRQNQGPSRVEMLGIWRENFDKKREKNFEGALHWIDNLLEKYHAPHTVNENHHLIEIFQEMSNLEDDFEGLSEKLEERDIAVIDDFKQKLDQFNLHFNTLTPELVDRVQNLYESLAKLRVNFS